MPVIIDPALYMKTKGDLFWVPEKRSLPTAFKLFTGTDTLRSLFTRDRYYLTEESPEAVEFQREHAAGPPCLFLEVLIALQ
jgi:hypothetical protein